MSAADRRLFVVGGACLALTVVGAVLRSAHVLPPNWATGVVLVAAGTGLRVYLGYAGRNASSSNARNVTRLISSAGLAIALVAAFAALPVLLRNNDGHFVPDLLAHVWTLVIIVLAAGCARTLNWQSLVGMSLLGFLGISGLAFTIGRPVVTSLGSDSSLATVLIVPLIEEVLKAAPAVLLLVLAARRAAARPSVVEMTLLGACIGAGFAMYEDTLFHRGGFDLGAMPLVSLLNPSATNDDIVHVAYSSSGHIAYTAVLVMGVSITLFYRHVYRWARWAAPVGIATALLEHFGENYAALRGAGLGSEAVLDVLSVVTLWGWLSSFLLIAGIAFFARVERRAAADGTMLTLQQRVTGGLWLRRADASRAARGLARLQAVAS